ncbi:MAG: DUF3822 family protein [Flavobacteriales bacterium]
MTEFDPELSARMKMPTELLNRASEFHLAIHVGASELHAALFDFHASQCLWSVYSEIPAGISPYKFIYQRNWIEGVFRKCTITFDSDNYALIPQSLFDPSVCSDYLEMQHGIATLSAGSIELPEAEAVICFEWPEWYADVMRIIPNARVIPQAVLLVRLSTSFAQSGEAGFVVAVSSGQATIAGYKKKSLAVLVTQEARTTEDILYHLSNAALRLQMDPENSCVHLLEAQSNSEHASLLRRYVKEVVNLSAPAGIQAPAITQLHFLCA